MQYRPEPRCRVLLHGRQRVRVDSQGHLVSQCPKDLYSALYSLLSSFLFSSPDIEDSGHIRHLGYGSASWRPGNVPRTDKEFEATVCWMSDSALDLSKKYLIKHTSKMVSAKVESLRYAVDVNTIHRSPQPTLELNHIGRCAFT